MALYPFLALMSVLIMIQIGVIMVGFVAGWLRGFDRGLKEGRREEMELKEQEVRSWSG